MNVKSVRYLLLLCGALTFTTSAAVKSLVVEGAPFPLTVKEWTPPQQEFRLPDYGAAKVAGDFATAVPVTEALEKAIQAAAQAGGGKVVIPAGEWKCGAFDLQSNTALILEKDAVLHFPDDPVLITRTPLRADGRPHLTRGGLINAIGCTNVAIMGEGTILCDVDYWHKNHLKNPKKGFPRPHAFKFARCQNVRFEGFKIRGSPSWTMHFLLCEDIVLRGVDSVCAGPNTDGLDLDSCRRALVENCSLSQTDNTYTIKSGMNEAGRKRNVPTEDVVIRNCRNHGPTLLAIGSEISGGVRNVYMTDCVVVGDKTRQWLRVKTNEKRGGYIENVWMENIRGPKALSVMDVTMFYDGNPNKELGKQGEKKYLTAIKGIHVKNVACAVAQHAVNILSDADLPPTNLTAENIHVGCLEGELIKVEGPAELTTTNVTKDTGMVVVKPVETKDALINPDMGLVCYNMAGRMWAYGSRTKAGDTLDWFPGVSTIYFRFLWSELEPEEGQYRWDMIDSIAQNWIAKGKKIAFRVICCNQTDNAVPQYVRDAGAKGIWFRYKGHNASADFPLRWEPKYDDPIFLAKYERFLQNFAARYDGNSDVAFVDIGSFGMYGEGHTGGTSKLSRAETERIARLHMQLHRRLLPKTLLIISDDVAGSGAQDAEHPLMKYTRELGIGYRDDSIFCMGPQTNSFAREGAWAHSHWARNFAPETPVVIETGHWFMCCEAGRFLPERLLECVEKHQASYLSIHAFPEPYYAALKKEMAQVNLRLGYRFALQEVDYPETVKAGETVTVRSKWINRGVSWLHGGASLTWTLLDDKGAVCWSITDPTFNFRALRPTLNGKGKAVVVATPCRFGRNQPILRSDPVCTSAIKAGFDPGTCYVMLKGGVYTLAVSVGSNCGTPQIALPLQNGIGRRYPIGKITVRE